MGGCTWERIRRGWAGGDTDHTNEHSLTYPGTYTQAHSPAHLPTYPLIRPHRPAHAC